MIHRTSRIILIALAMLLYPLANTMGVSRLIKRSNIHTYLSNKDLVKQLGYINGKFTKGSSSAENTFDVINPANGDVLAQLPRMNGQDVKDASSAANDAFKTWKHTTSIERSKILKKMGNLMGKYIDDLATIITLEAGKPLAEAKGEIIYAQSFYDFYAEEATRVHGEILQSPIKGRRLLTMKQPIGPAGLITPWNFPSAMITRKMGPALAAGCTVVIKPSEETPLSALALCAIAEEAGVPPGVINCLTVGRQEVVEVGTAMCQSELLRKISFTGSTNVGKWLMRESSSTVKRLSLELGGNAPFIVFDDADLDVALAALMAAKFRNAGQACIASNRIFVQEAVYDKFATMLATKVQASLKCGNGLEAGITMGPLINSAGLAKVRKHVETSLQQGAVALTGGDIESGLNAAGGSFFQPTVLTGVTKDMLPYSEETFGPVAPLFKFKTEAEAIEMANDTRFGLGAYACTKDLARAWRVSEALEFGLVGINEGAISTVFAPFGGMKESGLGREGSAAGLDEYLELKYVCMGLGER